MKKIITLSIVAMFAFVGTTFAQRGTAVGVGSVTTAFPMLSGDSSLVTGYISNTLTKRMQIKVTQSTPCASLQIVITKGTGTPAGYAILQGSNDGTNWVSLTDSLALTNVATQTKTWVLPNSNVEAKNQIAGAYVQLEPTAYLPYLYYGINVLGGTTVVEYVKAYFVPRR